MFTTLLETRATRDPNWRGQVASIVVHGVMIAGAVTATHRVVEATDVVVPEQLVFVRQNEPLPEPVAPRPPVDAVVAPPPPKGFQVLTAPIHIPDVLPAIDLTRAVTNAADFDARSGVPGGTADGVVGAPPRPVSTTTAYHAFEVDKPAALLAGSRTPDYPELLKTAGIQGTVRASFVIGADGRVEMATVRVIESSHALFTAAVRAALPVMRFLPGEVAGTKVRQLVEMPFAFTIK